MHWKLDGLYADTQEPKLPYLLVVNYPTTVLLQEEIIFPRKSILICLYRVLRNDHEIHLKLDGLNADT